MYQKMKEKRKTWLLVQFWLAKLSVSNFRELAIANLLKNFKNCRVTKSANLCKHIKIKKMFWFNMNMLIVWSTKSLKSENWQIFRQVLDGGDFVNFSTFRLSRPQRRLPSGENRAHQLTSARQIFTFKWKSSPTYITNFQRFALKIGNVGRYRSDR